MRHLVHVISIIFGLAVLTGAQTAKHVEFSRELIRVAVETGGITVDASYVFTNDGPAPQRQALFYPFPVDSLHPYPDEVDVTCDGREVGFERQGSGVVISIDVPAHGEAVMGVTYHQPSDDGSGCYILTTTAAWESPLEVARFEITVPDDLELVEVSYLVDEVVASGHAHIHVIDREDFLPDHDLCFSWRPADLRPQR